MPKKNQRVRMKQVGGGSGSLMPPNPLSGLEEINLPPKPDPNVSLPWPSHDGRVMAKCSKFSTIYPSYLDSTKTIKLGRRIALTNCIAKPTVYDISEALQTLKLRHVVQPNKGYSRDVESRWYNPGRVLVELPENNVVYDIDVDTDVIDGSGQNSKMKLIQEVSSIIPKLPGRSRRLEAAKKQLAEEKEKERSKKSKGSSTGGGSGTGGSSNKKKGKKKR